MSRTTGSDVKNKGEGGRKPQHWLYLHKFAFKGGNEAEMWQLLIEDNNNNKMFEQDELFPLRGRELN